MGVQQEGASVHDREAVVEALVDLDDGAAKLSPSRPGSSRQAVPVGTPGALDTPFGLS